MLQIKTVKQQRRAIKVRKRTLKNIFLPKMSFRFSFLGTPPIEL